MRTLSQILNDPWLVFFYGYLFHFIRYAVIAGGAYLIFYVVLRGWMLPRKIQRDFPRFAQMRRETLYSLLSFVIFAATGVLTLMTSRLGWTHVYLDISSRGWGYFWGSLVLLVLIHDTWFYWTHRLMHWRRLFPVMHRIHHQSGNPTPWAAFSFHPLEAVVQAIIFPLAAVVIPFHIFVAGLWLLYMTLMNVAGHLGFEILPRGFAKHQVLRWHNTPVHHDMHHRYVDCNYGLYFNVWDRLMGTNHQRYEQEYDCVTDAEHARIVEHAIQTSAE